MCTARRYWPLALPGSDTQRRAPSGEHDTMCGIAGIYSASNVGCDHLTRRIRQMCAHLVHRGPDDHGYYVTNRIAFGHRRLSIIDLETGRQPIFNEDQTKCVIFNGEIYNYKELR